MQKKHLKKGDIKEGNTQGERIEVNALRRRLGDAEKSVSYCCEAPDTIKAEELPTENIL